MKRVLCPNCHVLANRFISRTEKNPNRAFHKCPYYAVSAILVASFSPHIWFFVDGLGGCFSWFWFQVGGCRYYQWEDEMVDFEVQTQTTPAPLHAVPLQVVISGADQVAMYQEGSQAVGVVGNAVVENRGDNRVMQQLRWIEKLIYVCIFMALYAIMKK